MLSNLLIILSKTNKIKTCWEVYEKYLQNQSKITEGGELK